MQIKISEEIDFKKLKKTIKLESPARGMLQAISDTEANKI